MRLNECADFLKVKDDYILITHRRPDGDTIGSAGALCLALRAIGKKAYLFNNQEFTENYTAYVQPLTAPEGYAAQTTVAVDLASVELFPYGFEGDVDLCIDHHPSNTGYAKQSIVWEKKASCGELVFEIIKAMDVQITVEIAECLYVAVSTDTGCFAYANTKAETLRTAADILDYGVDNGVLNKKLFRAVSKARLALEGAIYSTLDIHRDGELVIATITREMMEAAGTTDNDYDDLASLAGRLAGSRITATIKETESGTGKISVRSVRGVDANAVCEKFGGGGHQMAAGCTIEQGYKEAKSMLLEAMLEALK